MSALDDQLRETVTRALESIRGRLESDLGSCQDELVRAAQDATRSAAEAAETATAEVRRDAERRIGEMLESAARDAEERARLSAEIEDLQHRLNQTREEHQRQIEERDRRLEESDRRFEESTRRIEETSRAFEESRLQLEAAGRDIETARSETESTRQRADAAREEANAAREEADAAIRSLEEARQELDATRENVEATLRDIDAARRDSDAVRGEVLQLSNALGQRDERAAQAGRLPEAVRLLDEAATFGNVLETLAGQAGREAGRAAVFLVKGDRLRDWRTVGFELASDAPRLDIGIGDSGPMAEAVRSGRGVRLMSGEPPLPDFARNEQGRDAAAWPIVVGGSVVAVLYADSPAADKPDEPYWPAFLEVLARHAGRVLEGITVRQAAGLMSGRPIGMSSSTRHQSSGSIQ